MGKKQLRRKIDKPVIFKEGRYKKSEIKSFKKNNNIDGVIDIFELQLSELFEIDNPQLIYTKKVRKKKDVFIKNRLKNRRLGSWVYFPWNGKFIHMLGEKDYFRLRTNRNRNLITLSEQKKLEKSVVGIIGLSIGSAYARNLVQQGIARTLKLVEFDFLETTNLNRVYASVADLGLLKLQIIAKQIYELDPYWKLDFNTQGLNAGNLNNFLAGGEPVGLIIEAIDDLKMKIRLRLAARKYRIPVVMFTNLGDRVMIDIERYDIDKNSKMFNGVIGNVPEKILRRKLTPKNINNFVTELVGLKNTPRRALNSLSLIGKELVGRPQLAGTVNISGGLSAFIARKIILGKNVPSGRYLFRFGSIFS